MRNRSHSIIFFIVIFLPVFLGYELGRGFVTDANPFNVISSPVFPISAILVILCVVFCVDKRGLVTLIAINLMFGVLAIVIFLSTGLFRQFAYNIAILLGSASYFIGLSISKENSYQQIVENLTRATLIILGMKLFSDVLFHSSLNSDIFLVEKIKIYNFYDYFPLIYLVSGGLAILVFKYNRLLAFFAFSASFISVISHSRFYVAGLFVMYLLCSLKVYKVKTAQLISFSYLLVVLITAWLAFSPQTFSFDPSLSLRLEHWHSFFKSTEMSDLLFPFVNAYRQELSWGGLHNELLELYSYFGIFVILLVGVCISLVSDLDSRAKVAMVPMMVTLIFGMLIQNNFTQPFCTVIIFSILGLFRRGNDEPSYYSSSSP